MKLPRIALFVSIIAACTGTAWAQFGLYGSPEMLNLSQAEPAVPAFGGHATRSVGPIAPVVPPVRVSYPSVTRVKPGPPVRAVSTEQYTMIPAEPVARELSGAASGAPGTDTSAPGGNMVDQMLGGSCCAEPDCGGDPGYGCGAAEDLCGQFTPAAGTCCPWYASVTALVMGRNRPNRLWTSYEATDVANQLTSTEDIGLPWSWGAEVRFGRRFCCDQWSLEATYWSLDPFDGYASTTHPNGVSTPLVISGIEFAGVNGTVFFDGAAEHRLWREDEIHNVELNLIRNRILTAYDLPWDVDWLLGVRYFRFKEGLTFGSLDSGYTWGQDGGIREAYLHDDVTNDLVGFQLGFDASYYAGPAWRLFVAPKFGIYNNHIENYFNAYRGDGTVANPTVASGRPESYPVRSSKDVVALLTQIDLGLEWQFAPKWSAQIGYRLVAITDVALADDQIPPYVVDIPEIAAIDHNGDLILHGAFVGVTYNF